MNYNNISKMKYIDKNGNPAPSVIIVDGMQVINPTAELYAKAGYVECIESMPTEPELLTQAVARKVAEIQAYDASGAVNSFRLNGMQVWLNREDRIGTTRAIELDKAAGKSESDIWLNGFHLTVNCDLALAMLGMLERYAYAAYNKTQEHIYNVKQLASIADVEKYDFRTGYPAQLDLKTV